MPEEATFEGPCSETELTTFGKMPVTGTQPLDAPLQEAQFYTALTPEEMHDLRTLISEYTPEEQVSLARKIISEIGLPGDVSETEFVKNSYLLNQIIGAQKGLPRDDVRGWSAIEEQGRLLGDVMVPESIKANLSEVTDLAGRIGGRPGAAPLQAGTEEYYAALGRFSD